MQRLQQVFETQPSAQQCIDALIAIENIESNRAHIKQLIYALCLHYICEITESTFAGVKGFAEWYKAKYKKTEEIEFESMIAVKPDLRLVSSPHELMLSAQSLMNERLERLEKKLDRQFPAAAPIRQKLRTEGLGGEYALSMLLDTRATAALVHELLFQKPADILDEKSNIAAVDFGCGTGILTLATAIHMARNRMSGTVYGFDNEEFAIENSTRVLGNSLCLPNIHFNFKHGNLCVEWPYRNLQSAIEQNREKLHYWVSETFNTMTPSFSIGTEKVQWRSHSYGSKDSQKDLDPLPYVIDNSIVYVSNFWQSAQNGTIRMFPDVLHNGINFDIQHSWVRLLTSNQERVLLDEVGKQYSEFESFGIQARWHCLKEVREKKNEDKNKNSARDKKKQERKNKKKNRK